MPADVTCLSDSDAEFLGFPTRSESLNFKVIYVCHFQLLLSGQCSNHCLQLRPLRQLTFEFVLLKVGLVLVKDSLHPCIPGRPLAQTQWMLRGRHDSSLNLDVPVCRKRTSHVGQALCSARQRKKEA